MSDRISTAVKRAGGAEAVAQRLGCHETTVYAWMRNGRVAWPKLLEFADATQHSWIWLAAEQLGASLRGSLEAWQVGPADPPAWLVGRCSREPGVDGLVVDGRLAMLDDWVVLVGHDPDGLQVLRIVSAVEMRMVMGGQDGR